MQSGRLIKKKRIDEKSGFEIEEYKWPGIFEDFILPDNPRKSVILKDYHSSQELNSSLHEAGNFQEVFQPKSVTLEPVDLSNDYKISQRELLRKRRRTVMDEDDVVNLELAELARNGGATSWRQHHSGKSEQSSDSNNEVKESKLLAETTTVSQGSLHSDVIATNKAAELLKVSNVNEEHKQEVFVQQNIFTSKQHDDDSRDEIVDFLSSKKSTAVQDGFEKGYKEGLEKAILENKKNIVEEENETLRVRQKSYEEGFAQGEEKGLISGYSKVEKYFENIAELSQELLRLKKETLLTGKDIFLEITKICVEKILRQQCAFRDDTLFRLYESIAANYTGIDVVVLDMHPDDAVRMKKVISQKNFEHHKNLKINENKNFKVGDFKVTNNNSVTLVEIQKAIDQIIEKLKPDLFDENSLEVPKEELKGA